MKLISTLLAISVMNAAQASDKLCGWFSSGEGVYSLRDKPENDTRDLVFDYQTEAYDAAAELIKQLFKPDSKYAKKEHVQYATSTFYEGSTHFCACFDVTDYSPKHGTIASYNTTTVKFKPLSVCYKSVGDLPI